MYISKFECPLFNQFQIANIIYKAKITSNRQNYQGKIYYGTSVGTFKQRYGNQKKLFNHERHRTDTERSNEFWRRFFYFIYMFSYLFNFPIFLLFVYFSFFSLFFSFSF